MIKNTIEYLIEDAKNFIWESSNDFTMFGKVIVLLAVVMLWGRLIFLWMI